MKLFLEPTISSLRKEYEDNDFADEEQFDEELLVRQGIESEVIDVADEEEFEIPNGMCACVLGDADDDEEYEDDEENEGENEDKEEENKEEYRLLEEVADGIWEERPICDNLQSGKYKLEGHLIKVIKLDDED